MGNSDLQVCAYLILASLGAFIMIPIGSVGLSKHSEYTAWPLLECSVGESTCTTKWPSTCEVESVALDVASNASFPVVIQWPAPPQSLNLKTHEDAMLWRASLPDSLPCWVNNETDVAVVTEDGYWRSMIMVICGSIWLGGVLILAVFLLLCIQ